MQHIHHSANYLAIEILANLGLQAPTQSQIDLMESVVSKTKLKKFIAKVPKLNAKEITCLKLAAKGCCVEEIARILQVKPTTVNWYKREILRKLKCKNITQAVFEGIKQGCLSD